MKEGFQGGIYSLDEAKKRINNHQAAIAIGEGEIKRLQETIRVSASVKSDIEAMRTELRTLRDRNLDEATFEEKLDIVSKLGIKVYPSEDLKSMRVLCQLNLEELESDDRGVAIETSKSQADGERELQIGCGKVHSGPPCCTVGRTTICS